MKNLMFIGLVCLTGCAIGGGAKVERTVTNTNGVTTVESATLRPFVAFGDAGMSLTKAKIGNTKAGNSIGFEGFEQSVNTTNLPANLKGGGALIGEAVKAFMGGQ